MGLSVQREGTGFKNPENKYLHSFLNSLWFKCCLHDSMRMWEFVYLNFLLFSDIFPMVFHGPLAQVGGWKQGGVGNSLSPLVSQKASTVLLTQYAWGLQKLEWSRGLQWSAGLHSKISLLGILF